MSNYKLNKSQQEAIEYNNGHLLIVAGAGTGKTTVITQKISYLIEQGLAKPEEILALTFTDKAANEMQDRVDELLFALPSRAVAKSGYVDMQISTFHSFCQKILENYGLDIGLPNQFKLLSQTDSWILIRQNLDKFNLDYYRPMGNPARHIHELIRHFSKCKDELITPADYLQFAESLSLNTDNAEFLAKKSKKKKTVAKKDKESESDDEILDIKRLVEIANAYHVYNQLLLDNISLDFGDLIFYTIKLLKDRPNILTALQKRFKYILVDEFQDVNWSQYQLVRLLIGKNNLLTAVGDDDQSIYAFRGASVSNILRFKDDYPESKEIVLSENYRSPQEILDLAYKSIQNNNPDRLEIKLGIDKKLIAQKNGSKTVESVHCESVDDEVSWVTKKIFELHEKESADWGDFAILVRANSQAQPFINGLERAGIPFVFLASTGLFRQPVVLDCLNFFRVIDNYHESGSIYRLLCLSFWKLSNDDLQKLTYSAKKKALSYYQALKKAVEWDLSSEGVNICNKLLALIYEGAKQSHQELPSIILYKFLESSGYLQYLAHEEENGNRNIVQQIYYLKNFLDYLTDYEKKIPGVNLSQFLEHYNYLLESGDEGGSCKLDSNVEALNILTAHSAKGLEFKYVFVVNLVEEKFPTRRHGEGIEIPLALVKEHLPEGDYHYEEERRLFYVAVTRAKEKLFLTLSDDYGGKRKAKISRFLLELEKLNSESFKNLSIDKLTEAGKYPKPQIKNKEKLILPDHFSYSQISSFERCPYQYKLAYILHLPTKGNASFSFGQTMHSTLQKFYERMQELNSVKQNSLFDLPKEEVKLSSIKTPSLEDLLSIYETNWLDDWYLNAKQKEDYYKKGKEALKLFYLTEKDNWNIPLVLEGPFKIRIGDFTINGRIDRIDKLADGNLEILDYKTGQAKEKIIGEDKEQLLIYQMAVASLAEYSAMGSVAKLTFFYLNENVKLSFLGNPEDLSKLTNKLLGSIEQIRAGNFIATPSKHTCSHCDFKDICEFRNL